MHILIILLLIFVLGLFLPAMIWAIEDRRTYDHSRSLGSYRRKSSRLSGTAKLSLSTKLGNFWTFTVRKNKPFSNHEIEQQLMLLDYYETIGESNGGWYGDERWAGVTKAAPEERSYYDYVDNKNKMRG